MKVIVLLSGGQDSTTALFWAVHRFEEVEALAFDYGQRHRIELESAQRIADMAGVNLEVVKVEGILQGSALLSDEELPGEDAVGVQATFVPMRNQFFLTIAGNRAFVKKAEGVVIGVSQVDYSGYPDCREDFIRSFTETTNRGTFTNEPGTRPGLKIFAPFLYMSKAQEVLLATELPGCYEALAYSHTAYDGSYPPKGEDNASRIRATAFRAAMVPDPLILRAHHEGKLKQLPNEPNYDVHVRGPYEIRLTSYLNTVKTP